MLLRTLSMKHPDRVEADTTVRGQQRWTIYPPPTARRDEPVAPFATTEVDEGDEMRALLRRLARNPSELE
jgi:hypothetical protein